MDSSQVPKSEDLDSSQVPKSEDLDSSQVPKSEDLDSSHVPKDTYYTRKFMLQYLDTASQELLFSYGVNFNDLPNWQKRGVGLFWEEYEKQGINPLLGQPVNAVRRRIKVELDLPMKKEYRDFLLKLI